MIYTIYIHIYVIYIIYYIYIIYSVVYCDELRKLSGGMSYWSYCL